MSNWIIILTTLVYLQDSCKNAHIICKESIKMKLSKVISWISSDICKQLITGLLRCEWKRNHILETHKFDEGANIISEYFSTLQAHLKCTTLIGFTEMY